MTRSPLSRSKGQSHQAALLTAVLARQAAAAVGVGTCWPWETAATLPSARRRKALLANGGGEGRGYIMAAARLQLVCKALGFLYVHFMNGHYFRHSHRHTRLPSDKCALLSAQVGLFKYAVIKAHSTPYPRSLKHSQRCDPLATVTLKLFYSP